MTNSRLKNILITLLMAALAGCGGSKENDSPAVNNIGEIWYYQSNNVGFANTETIESMVYVDGFDEAEYVAVATDGILYRGVSIGALDAEAAVTGDDIDFTDVAAGLGAAVAVGQTGAYASTKTIQFIVPESPAEGQSQGGTPSALNGIAYGAGTFVAVGDSGNIQTNSDPYDVSTWTQRTPDGGYSGNFTAVTYYNGLFVAVGTGGEIQTSSNASTWTQQTADAGFAGDFYDIAGGSGEVSGDMFVAVGAAGEMQYSSDGVTWTQGNGLIGGAGGYTCVAFADGVFLMAGGAATANNVEISQDPGTSWLVLTPRSGQAYSGCNGFPKGGDHRFVLFRGAGDSGYEWSTASCVFRTESAVEEERSSFTAAADNGTAYVALGPGVLAYKSTKPSDWRGTTQDAGGSGANLNSVIYDGSQFVAFGDSQQVETSTNGATWTEVNSGGVGDFNDGATGLGMYAAVGNTGSLWTSTDLITWTSQTLGGGTTNNMNAIIIGKGLFVAVGDSGEIQSSTDGTTWTQQTAAGGYTGDFQDINYSNDDNMFVAVGGGGEIQTSTDGVTWTQQTAADSYSDIFYGIDYVVDFFVAVGENGEIQVSEDGLTWVAKESGHEFLGDFFAVTTSAELAVAVGERGMIEESDSDAEVTE